MNRISLEQILYEGLLKVPPVLFEKIRNDFAKILASKYYGAVKDISRTESEKEQIEQIQKDKKRFEVLKDQIKAKILELNVHKEKIADLDYEDYKEEQINLGRSLSFAIYVEESLKFVRKPIDKISVKTYISPNTDEQEVDVKFFNFGNEVANFTESNIQFAAELSFNLDNVGQFDNAVRSINESFKDKQTEMLELRKYIEDQYGSSNLINTISRKVFSRNYMLTEPSYFEGWNPGGRTIDLSKISRTETGQPITLIVKIDFKDNFADINELGLYLGKVSRNFYSIAVQTYVPSKVNLNVFRRAMLELSETIYHELGHFVQDLLQHSVTGKTRSDYSGRFGYPSKKISQRESEITPEGEWAHKHELRDIEFYTRLGDSKSRIENVLNNLGSKEARVLAFKKIVGMKTNQYDFPISLRYSTIGIEPDSWFEVLKNENVGKWSKAVKELYKSLSGYFSDPILNKSKRK